jgi:uncharacterized membrane protein
MSKTIRFLLLAAASLLAACPSDDNGTEPTPTIAVSLGGAITVVQGQTGTTQVTVTRGGGFSGAVTLTASALPVGVTAAFNPATIPAGTGNGTSTLTLTAGANAPTGAGTFQVGASGGGSVTASATGNVTVTPAPDFSLNVTPNAVAIEQGGPAGVANVAITRTGGFTGAVNLTLTGLPTGVTAAFDNAAPTGNTAVLTLTAAANAALGPATITVNGSGTPGNRSAQFALTVQAPPGSFTLTTDPATVSIAQGGAAGTTTVSINKTGSFTGPVALTVTGLPTGVTGTFAPANASAGEATQDVQTTSVLTLTATAGATLGNHAVVIRGNAQGQTEKTTNLTVTVTASTAGGYSLSVNPDVMTIQQGANQQTTVTISKTGSFVGNVALSVTGLPTGVTATFAPPQASPGAEGTQDVQTTSVLTLTVAGNAEVKSSPLVIHGTAEGVGERTTNLSLTVAQATAAGFTLGLDPTTLSVEAGQNGQVTVNVNKTGTFTGPVALSAPNLPVGITVGFNPVQASPGKTTDVQTQSTMTVTVANTVAAGQHPILVRGTADGLPNHEVTLALTVTAAPGGFTLSANPSSVNIQAGQNGGTTILVNKTGSFTGNVALTVTGLPAGVTASFNPASASPRPSRSASRDVIVESVMSINVGGSVPVDDYTLVVHGNATGQDEETVNVTLNVTTGGGGSGNSTWKFCDLDNLPIWFAFQDGNGAWTQVTATTGGDGSKTYTFDLTQATGGVAFVTGGGASGFVTSVSYGSQAQLVGGAGTCFVQPMTRTLNGSVASIDLTDNVSVSMGGGTASANAAAPNFVLDGVLDGPSDLIAIRNSVSLGLPPTITPIGMIIRRGLNIANNGTIPVLDFGAGPAEAFAPLAADITVNNLSGDTPILSLGYETGTTSAGLFTSFNAPAGPITVYGVPGARQAANDLHQLSVIASGANSDIRFRLQWFKTLTDMIVNLGPPLTAPTVTSLGNAPYPRYQSVGPIQAEYDDVFYLSVSPDGSSGGDFLSWTVTAFRAYFAGGNYTLLMDDMSAAGYQAIWGPAIGEDLNLQTQAVGFSTNGIANPVQEGGFANYASNGVQRTP